MPLNSLNATDDESTSAFSMMASSIEKDGSTTGEDTGGGFIKGKLTLEEPSLEGPNLDVPTRE
jgi:hypothetical protein